ncbi:biotin transporter BioY [Actinomyces gaoshouyii]|uniref:biotin transporter BioY n=1 Tax=Actinomyces gaoshouyii TaxID=1960083 RepID=UPI0009BD4814|nr:biotin transporter BioY [Actinomyces gaoshouyii]ARD41207.1 BioY family transporter [Actinomyces gaoshouyii]
MIKKTSPATGAAAVATAAAPSSRLALAARETALIGVGTTALALIGQISLPLPFTPVPVTLGSLAALGVGAVLGSRRGIASSLLLAALAAVGAPVLAGWSSGVTASFGYVLGYALAAGLAGRVARSDAGLPTRFALMLIASSSVFVPGVIWLKIALGVGWGKAVALGLTPFLVGDVLKAAFMTVVTVKRR